MHSTSSNPSKKLFLLDAFALIYRSYYAFIKNPRYTSSGMNTSAILGFTNTLLEVLEKEQPSHLMVVFDPKGPTFRHEMYKEYKAQRPPMPEDIRNAIPFIKQIIQGFNIVDIDVPGYEADDVIGTLAKKAEAKGFTVYMMTPDKDYAQLVSPNIFMYKPKRSGKEVEVWGVPEIMEHFGVSHPDQIIDLLGLMGDVSDNIPGCPGIGPKSAQKLIASFGSIEGVYENTDQLKGKQKERMEENEAQVRFSKVLARIALDAPIDFDDEKCKLIDFNEEKLKPIFRELEFYTMTERVFGNRKVENKESLTKQGSLFASEDEKSEAYGSNENKEIIVNDINSVDLKFYTIDNQDKRASLRADLCVQKEFAFTTVLSHSDPNEANLQGLIFSYEKNEAFFVPMPSDVNEGKKMVEEFRFIFQDENILKIAHNIKKDLLILKWYGMEIKGQLFDTMIAHYLIQPELKHDLDYLGNQLLSYQLMGGTQSRGKAGEQLSLDLRGEDQKWEILCEKTAVVYQLKEVLSNQLKDNQLIKLFKEIEMPLVPVLSDMEFSGVSVDVDALNEYAKELNIQVNDLEREIIDISGVEFNVSSPKQLGEVLFDRMQLDSKAKRTKSGQYSTSEAVLVKLKGKHDIIGKILEYRSLKKLISTYVEALPSYINGKTGRIHTSFNQAETATGRLSSTNPNLQNIPIRTKQGRLIRKAFVASDKDHIFLSADYSQVELRLMAHMSQDPHMIQAFNENEDIHTSTAAKIFKIPPQEVSEEMRRRAKTANFGIIYGISAWGLAERLEITRKEGKELISGYFESYPGVKTFMEESIEQARKNEFVETIMGRRRYLKDINSNNAIVRGVAERNAINAPIQGSAADVIKLAMIGVYQRMREAGLKSRMILQVHDELNFDCLLGEVEQMKTILVQEMESAIKLSVPLTIDMGSGVSWLEAH